MTESRTERLDFQATSDPALLASADRGESHLLSYAKLYELWERQQWATQDLDFSRDREDWHERFDDEERFQRMYGLSAFFIGEQRVASELGPMMRAAPDEDMRLFLCTQIADEARHVAFFDRFYSEVGVLEAEGLEGRLAETSEHLNPEFGVLFDELLRRRVDRLAQGFTLVARDEHRHVAFGARFLRDMARRDPRHTEAIQRTLAEVAPVADGVLRPKWFEGADDEPMLFGASVEETRAFAFKALERRMKVIGLVAAA